MCHVHMGPMNLRLHTNKHTHTQYKNTLAYEMEAFYSQTDYFNLFFVLLPRRRHVSCGCLNGSEIILIDKNVTSKFIRKRVPFFVKFVILGMVFGFQYEHFSIPKST